MRYFMFFIFALFISVGFLIVLTLKKKKNHFEGEVTQRSYVLPICFIIAGLFGFVVSLTSFMSVVIWWVIVILVVVGAYFSKDLPKPK